MHPMQVTSHPLHITTPQHTQNTFASLYASAHTPIFTAHTQTVQSPMDCRNKKQIIDDMALALQFAAEKTQTLNVNAKEFQMPT